MWLNWDTWMAMFWGKTEKALFVNSYKSLMEDQNAGKNTSEY